MPKCISPINVTSTLKWLNGVFNICILNTVCWVTGKRYEKETYFVEKLVYQWQRKNIGQTSRKTPWYGRAGRRRTMIWPDRVNSYGRACYFQAAPLRPVAGHWGGRWGRRRLSALAGLCSSSWLLPSGARAGRQSVHLVPLSEHGEQYPRLVAVARTSGSPTHSSSASLRAARHSFPCRLALSDVRSTYSTGRLTGVRVLGWLASRSVDRSW